jgi:hypothetical protein
MPFFRAKSNVSQDTYANQNGGYSKDMDENMNVRQNCGDEVDAFGKHRRSIKWRPGELKAIKTRYNRRNRRNAKNILKEIEYTGE